jgi:LPXTG-site transpeptidase (sortase) family protein
LSGFYASALFGKHMQSRILLKQLPLIGALFGIAFFGAFLLDSITENSVKDASVHIVENTSISQNQEQAIFDSRASSVGNPMRLRIPSINVDATFEYVGITPDGAMDVPKDPHEVGWFNLGPRPGENGSAVIAGHYGWKEGKGAVFDTLYKVRVGDKIYVEDSKGEVVTFVVRESRRYDPEADASGVFSSSDGKAHLNLVTCEGEWDEVSKSYSKRLVVFADKE